MSHVAREGLNGLQEIYLQPTAVSKSCAMSNIILISKWCSKDEYDKETCHWAHPFKSLRVTIMPPHFGFGYKT